MFSQREAQDRKYVSLCTNLTLTPRRLQKFGCCLFFVRMFSLFCLALHSNLVSESSLQFTSKWSFPKKQVFVANPKEVHPFSQKHPKKTYHSFKHTWSAYVSFTSTGAFFGARNLAAPCTSNSHSSLLRPTLWPPKADPNNMGVVIKKDSTGMIVEI